MRWKITVRVTLVLVLAAAVFGIYKRQTYTDVSKITSYMDMLAVAEIPEGFAVRECEELKQSLPDSPFILKVSAVGAIENLFHVSRQKVKVEQVYQGQGIEEGEEIYILSDRWRLNISVDSSSGPSTMSRGFVNVMREGEEYLIFLSEQCVSLREEENDVYRLAGEEYVICPVFAYQEYENVIAETGEYVNSTYISYEKVKNNEFFAATEAGLDAMLELKRSMMELYP